MEVFFTDGFELKEAEAASAVTIGVFDGMHRGHAALVKRTVELAAEVNAVPTAITFYPHPLRIIDEARAPRLILTLEQRLELLKDLGIRRAVVVEFSKEFSRLSPGEFASTLLAKALRASVVVVGDNFRFGKDRSGDPETLKELGARMGFSVEVVPGVELRGRRISSSWIRSLIEQGEVALAAEALGHPVRIRGRVVKGDGRGGRELGYPTANLSTDPFQLYPADGVYGGFYTRLEKGERFAAALSVGTRPTFYAEKPATERLIEAYLLDFDGNLYGETGEVEFSFKIRDQMTFKNVEELVEQMVHDVEVVRRRLSSIEAWQS